MKTGAKLFVFLFLIYYLSTFAAEQFTTTEVKDQNFVADFYSTDSSLKKLGILVLGGSEGGKPDHLARVLAEEGYPVLSLAYFKTEGTSEYLDMIPLEYFDKPIQWLKDHEKVKGGAIAVVGGSKGAELALLLASRKPEIRGVVAFAPSSVVFQGIPKVFWPPRSSWTSNGKPVPFVPYDYSKGFNPNDLLSLYEISLEQSEAVKKATIEVQRINGPILLFSGVDDKMWPSVKMGDMICERLKDKKFNHKYEHFKYDKAGHTLNEYFMLGGTREGNKKARIDSTKKMLKFLEELAFEPGAPAEANRRG